MTSLLPAGLRRTERRLRLISILWSAKEAGVRPADTRTIHALAYLSDALSPVWHLPVLDGQILKHEARPYFPALQRDLDDLVGMGLVAVTRFDYVASNAGSRGRAWEVDADYEVDIERCKPIMDVASRYPATSRRGTFVREVTYAASGLGAENLGRIGEIDAAYSNPLVDDGDLLDMDPGEGKLNLTATVAERFRQLTADVTRLSQAELIHLYVRHLYTRLDVA